MPNLNGNLSTLEDKDDFWALYDFHLPSYTLNKYAFLLYLNTQYMTNSTLVCQVKIEYVTKNNIFGLKMMMKSGLEKIFHSLTMSFLLLNLYFWSKFLLSMR